MKGVILGLDAENSIVVILGSDDKRYRLAKSKWRSSSEPKVGMEIDFSPVGDDSAEDAYLIPKTVENGEVMHFTSKVKGLTKRFRKLLVGVCLLLLAGGFLILAIHGWHAWQLSNLRDRAEKGDARAQFDLGDCYFNAKLGLVENFSEAVKWYRQAADQNLAVAQATLGLICINNNDDVEGVKWLSKAAEQDESMAQLILSLAYERGSGVEQDMAEAYKWALLGDRSLFSGIEKTTIGVNAPKLASVLSPSQIVTGKQRASRFHSDHGKLKYDKGDWDGAIGDYTKAIQIDSDNADLFRTRGVILYSKKNDVNRALDDFNRMIELKPADVNAYIMRGNIWFTKDNQTQALVDYNKAIELKPDDAGAYNARGYLKEMKMLDLDGAIADYSKAIELKPNDAAARKNLGNLSEKIMVNPTSQLSNPNAYGARGNIKYRGHDLAGAIADFTKAIELDPGWAKAYLNRGFVNDANGDLDGAKADYSKAIELDPNLADKKWQQKLAEEEKQRQLAKLENERRARTELAQQAYNRGVTNKASGNLTGAINDFNKAIEINPDYADAYIERAHVKGDQGDWAGALADNNKLIELNPSDYFKYWSRGDVKFHLRDLDGALADYNKAIELKPDEADVYDRLGRVKNIKNDWAGALADYSKAIELVPDYARAYGGRALAKEKTGDLTGALADYNKAIELSPTLADPAWRQNLADEMKQQSIAEEEKQRQLAVQQESARLAEEKTKRLEAEQAAAAEKRAANAQQFQQLATSIPDSDKFSNYSRDFSSSFDAVWASVINVLKQQSDNIASSDPQNGLISTIITRHSIGLNPYGHYDRYLIMVERSNVNSTKVNLKLMRFIRTQSYSNDGNSPYATITTGLLPDPQMGEGVVERQSYDFFDKIGRELAPR